MLSLISATSSASLPEVERNHDQPLGHRGQVEGYPTNAVGREHSAAVALFQSPGDEKSASLANQIEQFATRDGRKFAAAISRSTGASAAAFSWAKISPTKGMRLM